MGKTTNRGSLSIGEEISVKVPGATSFKMPLRGEDFLNPLNFDPSNEFREDRLTTRYDLTSETAEGGLDVNFRYGVQDFIIGGAFVSSWAMGVSRDNAEMPSEISEISSTAVTVSSTDEFIPGSIVLFTGNNDFSNNRIFEVGAGSTTTSVVAVGGGLLPDASPSPNSKLETVGLQAGSGDISCISDGLSSTAFDFTTIAQLRIDHWIKIGGSGDAFRFTGQPQNNTWAKIALVEPNKLTLTSLPATWAPDPGTGKTVRVWLSDFISVGDGSLKQSFFVQKKIPVGVGAFKYMKLLGCYPSLYRIDTTARGRITSRAEFKGSNGSFDDDFIVENPENIGRHPFLPDSPRRPFVSGRSIARLHEGSEPYAMGSFCVPNISFTIQNQLIPVECVDNIGYDDMEFGEAETSQNGNINLRTASVYEKFRNETETSISCIMTQDQQAYVLDSPRGIFTTANINLPGPNQLIQIPFTFVADENVEGNSNANNKQYGMARFPYYEA